MSKEDSKPKEEVENVTTPVLEEQTREAGQIGPLEPLPESSYTKDSKPLPPPPELDPELTTAPSKPVRELTPLTMDKNYSGDEALYDFRPQPVSSDRPEDTPKEYENPKDWSAPVLVDTSSSTEKTEVESSPELDQSVNVKKDSTQLKE